MPSATTGLNHKFMLQYAPFDRKDADLPTFFKSSGTYETKKYSVVFSKDRFLGQDDAKKLTNFQSVRPFEAPEKAEGRRAFEKDVMKELNA